jgi:hypothetical protein
LNFLQPQVGSGFFLHNRWDLVIVVYSDGESEFTLLSYTGLVVELEHLKIKTRLTNEKFASVKGECEI